jgi:hypothetical protein
MKASLLESASFFHHRFYAGIYAVLDYIAFLAQVLDYAVKAYSCSYAVKVSIHVTHNKHFAAVVYKIQQCMGYYPCPYSGPLCNLFRPASEELQLVSDLLQPGRRSS